MILIRQRTVAVNKTQASRRVRRVFCFEVHYEINKVVHKVLLIIYCYVIHRAKTSLCILKT